MCWISPAATARRRSGRAICRSRTRHNVISSAQRVIASSIIAVKSISIRHNRHDRRRKGAGSAGGGQPHRRERGHGRLFRRAGSRGRLVAGHHGRCAKGAGLRCPGTAKLCNNRGARTDAMNQIEEDGRSGMRKILLSMALVLLIGAPGGFAQSGGGTSSAVKNSGGGGVLPAPVGHRQPRAGYVPDDKNMNQNDFLTKENAALDKKLKSICRGC